jgi:uncharacterized protein
MTDSPFLGFDFSPLKLDDRSRLTEFLRKYPQPLTGYTFASLAAWQPLFRYEWAFAEANLLLISCILEPDPNRHLLQPVGSMSSRAVQMLRAGADSLPYPLKTIGVSDSFLKEHPDFARLFAVAEDRAVSNYLYSANALAQLAGRKYAKKRNLLAQASGLYNWSCETLNSESIDRCFAVLNSIQEEERPTIQGMLKREVAALECTLKHFDEFAQQGLLVSVDNKPVAFSIYESISPTTVAIHFERALRSYKGLYQVVNCETAKVIVNKGFQFINREEDVGDPGLRDAKMSYHPIEIVPAYELSYKKQPAVAD